MFLLPDEILPVCSPQWVRNGALALEDLRDIPLLDSNLRRHDWHDWLASAGMPDFQAQKKRSFDEASVMVEAALAGLGIAITQSAFVQDELRSGRLVAPFGHVLRRNAGYYATYSKPGEKSPAVIAFCDWLCEITAPARSFDWNSYTAGQACA